MGASPNVRPTSVDHPNESEYLSEAVFNFDCFKDNRIFRLRLPFFLPGAFAAMGLKASLGVDVFNDFASSDIIKKSGVATIGRVIQSRMIHRFWAHEPYDLAQRVLQPMAGGQNLDRYGKQQHVSHRKPLQNQEFPGGLHE